MLLMASHAGVMLTAPHENTTNRRVPNLMPATPLSCRLQCQAWIWGGAAFMAASAAVLNACTILALTFLNGVRHRTALHCMQSSVFSPNVQT